MRFASGLFLATFFALPGSAHRLDEYLQATLLGISRGGVDVEIQLTPGVAVFPSVLPLLDRNLDGQISADEQTAYANWVAQDLELRLDGRKLPLRVVEKQFSSVQEMHEGLGSIRLKLHADGSGHRIRFENHHLPELSAWLVNCLSSPGDGLTVGPQTRDEAQRSIRFDYSFPSSGQGPSLGVLAACIMGIAGLAAVTAIARQKPRLNPKL